MKDDPFIKLIYSERLLLKFAKCCSQKVKLIKYYESSELSGIIITGDSRSLIFQFFKTLSLLEKIVCSYLMFRRNSFNDLLNIFKYSIFAPKYCKTSEICWIAVRSERRGVGIGSNLIKQAIMELKSESCEYVWCKTLTSTLDTNDFYLKNNFKEAWKNYERVIYKYDFD